MSLPVFFFRIGGKISMIEAVSYKIQAPWLYPCLGVAVVADTTYTREPVVFAPTYRRSHSRGMSPAASNYLDDGGDDNIVKHALVIGYVNLFFCALDLHPRRYDDEVAV